MKANFAVKAMCKICTFQIQINLLNTTTLMSSFQSAIALSPFAVHSSEYRKYLGTTLSPVEEEYLKTLQTAEKKVKGSPN